MTNKPVLNIALRGHVRNSMSDSRLSDLMGSLSDLFELNIFAHTWDIQQSSLSWRRVEDIMNPIDEESIRSYLGEENVLAVEVGKDGSIVHPGNTTGKIGRTNCPILGWKNMYYGKLRVCSLVQEKENYDSVTMQMRFDILSNPFSPKKDDLVEFAKREYDFILESNEKEKIRFLRMHCFIGMDNVYMARIEDMYRFVSYMYYDMDRILEVHNRTIHQEHIAFHERMSFFGYEPPSQTVN